jgi:hypothetical protein
MADLDSWRVWVYDSLKGAGDAARYRDRFARASNRFSSLAISYKGLRAFQALSILGA